MKIKLLFVAAIAAVLVAVGGAALLRATFTQATSGTLPVQPFAPGITTSLLSNKLGDTGPAGTAGLQFKISVPKGTRQTLPTFYASGFPMTPDKDITDGTVSGTVTSDVDIFCDGTVDLLAQNDAPSFSPYTFYERTTNVDTDGQLGTDPEDYVRFNSPLYSMIARLRSDLVGIWIGGTSGFFYTLPTALPLNSTQMQVPWMPAATAGQVALGGDPGPPNGVCQDSPQNSTSTEIGVMSNPALAGDSGGPCPTCTDATVTGLWGSPDGLTAATSAQASTQVNEAWHNGGPASGTFNVHFVAEPPDGVTAAWTTTGSDTVNGTDLTINGASGVVTGVASSYATLSRTLTLTCPATAGSYLVPVKNIWYAAGATKDQDAINDAWTTDIRLNCGDISGLTQVDKEVVWVKPIGVTGFNNTPSEQQSTPEHLQLVVSNTVTVSLDEMKIYHPVVPGYSSVPGDETLVAVAPAGVTATWVTQAGDTVSGDALSLTATEPAGTQVDVNRDLQVQCTNAAASTWPQPLVIEASDWADPTAYAETTPGDNTQRHVISVWCYATSGGITAAMDNIDDATGLYMRWTAFISNADVRKSITEATLPPTGSPGDVDYVERMVIPECYWIDANNSPGHAPPDINGDGFISAAESMQDPDLLAMGGWSAIDADHDCVENAAYAQPGHPVDSVDTPTGTNCPALVYSNSGGAIQVQYDTAADQDCDGLTDGVEAGWGSNPKMADTDADGSPDFLEMFEFTNPGNPDSDYDGPKDRPEDDYVAAPAGGFETNGLPAPNTVNEAVNADDNCPTIPNPDQLNTDGKPIANGAGIPGSFSSNPDADTLGDACDTDDDNDGISDVAELQYMSFGGTCTLDPLKSDTDGDHALDGMEIQLGNNPCLNAPTAASLDAGHTTLFRGGGINVPALGAYGGLWDQTNSGDPPYTVRREMNADADYSGSPPSAANSVNSKGDGGTDVDNDDGSNGNPAEISDVVEAKGFNTGISRVDTDGDGCADWIEIADVNGDRKANILDVLQVAQTALGGEVTTEPDLRILDINKDRVNNILDVQVEAKNSDLITAKAHSKCASDTER